MRRCKKEQCFYQQLAMCENMKCGECYFDCFDSKNSCKHKASCSELSCKYNSKQKKAVEHAW